MATFYRLKDDVIRLDSVNLISKRDEWLLKDNDKDEWKCKKFYIQLDSNEYEYESERDRDTVYNDIMCKLVDNNQTFLYTDRQAMAASPY